MKITAVSFPDPVSRKPLHTIVIEHICEDSDFELGTDFFELKYQADQLIRTLSGGAAEFVYADDECKDCRMVPYNEAHPPFGRTEPPVCAVEGCLNNS